ncbi:hypothetical protein LCGC14_1227890 [marine sediment metagenome]|uniref:Uncharacterized protein n=1 Tax=marine sediment metagenome TaxID=412755 RepID=A0A0F9NRL9_9ZZZZ|nr:hypothetical protein [Candidatus Scalindua sp.]
MDKQAIFHREGRTINIILHDFSSAKLKFDTLKGAKLVNAHIHEVIENMPDLLNKSDVENFIAEVKSDILRSNRSL